MEIYRQKKGKQRSENQKILSKLQDFLCVALKFYYAL